MRYGEALTLKGTLRELVRDRLALAGLLIYGLFILVAIFAPWIAPHAPDEIIREGGKWYADQPPSARFLLGTTNMGRDIFSQLVFGTRPTLLVGFTAAFLVALIGTIVGMISGYLGGTTDNVLMRLTDITFGVPFEPFVIVLVAFLGPSLWNIVIAMALLLWRDTARVIRAQVLSLRERDFVEAARVIGASPVRILMVHIAPNVIPLSFLYGSLAVGWAVLTEAAISFLGFGDPKVISWGYMLHEAFGAQALARGAYYWFVPPGICIMLAIMGGFMIGRGAEELLYPRLRRFQ